MKKQKMLRQNSTGGGSDGNTRPSNARTAGERSVDKDSSKFVIESMSFNSQFKSPHFIPNKNEYIKTRPTEDEADHEIHEFIEGEITSASHSTD